jgi:hypothetical protein
MNARDRRTHRKLGAQNRVVSADDFLGLHQLGRDDTTHHHFSAQVIPIPALELLCLLSPHPAPIKCILSELRLANDIELRALCDELRIKYSVNTKYQRAPYDSSRITHVSVADDTWPNAQRIAQDYLEAMEIAESFDKKREPILSGSR